MRGSEIAFFPPAKASAGSVLCEGVHPVHPDIPQLTLVVGEGNSWLNLCLSWISHMGLLLLELLLDVLVWEFSLFWPETLWHEITEEKHLRIPWFRVSVLLCENFFPGVYTVFWILQSLSFSVEASFQQIPFLDRPLQSTVPTCLANFQNFHLDRKKETLCLGWISFSEKVQNL